LGVVYQCRQSRHYVFSKSIPDFQGSLGPGHFFHVVLVGLFLGHDLGPGTLAAVTVFNYLLLAFYHYGLRVQNRIHRGKNHSHHRLVVTQGLLYLTDGRGVTDAGRVSETLRPANDIHLHEHLILHVECPDCVPRLVFGRIAVQLTGFKNFPCQLDRAPGLLSLAGGKLKLFYRLLSGCV